jgi:arylsulfatase A-like enzyme
MKAVNFPTRHHRLLPLAALAVSLAAKPAPAKPAPAKPAPAKPAPAKPAPNFVFILADDLGVNDLGAYGRSDHRTPRLDRLAAEGARFSAAYAAQPICSPARAAILTGKAPARLRLTTYLPGRPDCASQKLLHPRMRTELPLEEATLAELLARRGYVSALIGKWHLGGKGFLPPAQGFDVYHPGAAVTEPTAAEGGKGEYDLTARAEEFIEKHRARPFFLLLAHNSPHVPFSARAGLVERNAGALNPVYAAVIETLDDAVGRLLARLETLGLAEKTLVIFTSDNGGLHVPEATPGFVTHNSPFRAGKGFLHEGGLRVPLIVRWPGKVPAGRVVETPVSQLDWVPTLLEIAGLSVPDGLDGVSIAPLLRGEGRPAPRALFWHFPHYTNQGGRPAGAVIDGDWKLIEHYEDGRLELHDLRADPGERVDLSAREAERAAALRARLAAWRERAGAEDLVPNPELDASLHRALYEDLDVSRLEPAKADAAMLERVLAWRRAMNAAVERRRK